MLKKVKKWLGIDGVRINVEIPEDIFLHEKKVSGLLILESRQDSIVTEIRIRFIEKYSRGRKQNKLIDEYLLGTAVIDRSVYIQANKPLQLPFDLYFEPLKSEMDQWESKNFILKGIVRTAKLLRRVNSQFRLEIEADVQGMAISPLVKTEVKVIV